MCIIAALQARAAVLPGTALIIRLLSASSTLSLSWGRLMGVLAEGSALPFCNGLSRGAQDRNST